MRTLTRFIAAIQLALILPAALFLTSVLVGAGSAPQYELAHVAQRIVLWYSERMWTLWLVLLAMPLVGLAAGCATLARNWNQNAEPAIPARQSLAAIPAPLATLFIAGMTLTSAWIIAIVALHMLAN